VKSQSDNRTAEKPPNAELLIKKLRGLKYDPNATRSFELMSGGFLWSDERPGDYDDVAAGYAFRLLIGFRASLICGKPREELRFVWDALRAGNPDWPGFRAERLDTALVEELDSENGRAMRRLEAMVRLFGREARNEAEKHRGD
jgi:hypothetical protein